MIKQKFIVIKQEDADKYLPNHDKIDLRHILRQINEGRAKEGKKDNEYLVVNKDESYADLVKNLILNKLSDNDIPEEIKEKILKGYAEDIYEEFMQIDRFEGKITLKDIADILQIESEVEQ